MNDGRERLDPNHREKIRELNRRIRDHRGGMSPEERAVFVGDKMTEYTTLYSHRSPENKGLLITGPADLTTHCPRCHKECAVEFRVMKPGDFTTVRTQARCCRGKND